MKGYKKICRETLFICYWKIVGLSQKLWLNQKLWTLNEDGSQWNAKDGSVQKNLHCSDQLTKFPRLPMRKTESTNWISNVWTVPTPSEVLESQTDVPGTTVQWNTRVSVWSQWIDSKRNPFDQGLGGIELHHLNSLGRCNARWGFAMKAIN